MSLIDGTLGSIQGKTTGNNPASAKYVFHQQAGCLVRVYHQNGKVTDLFSEIESCTADRTITDVAGSFSIGILGTKEWDEIIEADDFVRIFMGDQVVSLGGSPAAYNVASLDLRLVSEEMSGFKLSGTDTLLQIPVTGAGLTRGVQHRLMMYERFFGKIDRCERMEKAPGKAAGSSVQFMVSGRGFLSILQDMSLYYNEFVPGLNAVNIWYKSLISTVSQPPDEIVKAFLGVLLSAVPFPQWQLPPRLVNDYLFGGYGNENIAQAAKNLAEAASRITAEAVSNPNFSLTAVTEFTSLVRSAIDNPAACPLSILSFKGIEKTHGRMFNTTFLNSTTTGVYDFIKYLGNSFANEFWFDLCPGGVTNGGKPSVVRGIPTVVMRQRPYNITNEMMRNAAPYFSEYKEKLSLFPPFERDGVSSSMFDLSASSFTVIGPINHADVLSTNSQLKNIGATDVHFTPTLIDYQVGRSAHDRTNAFQVLASYPTGQQNQDKAVLAGNGGFKVDKESVRRYGLRVMELSTPYACPDDSKSQQNDHTTLMNDFGSAIANWYFMNPAFLNGRIVARFLPDARPGVPVNYVTTRPTLSNPEGRAEQFYCQGVADTYRRGQVLTTNLTVTRGIRYRLADAKGSLLDIQSNLGNAAANFAKGLA